MSSEYLWWLCYWTRSSGVLFCPKTYIQPAPSNVFSERCTCTICWPSEIPWYVDKRITGYSETSEITILCSKQNQRHVRLVFSCNKNTLFRAYCMPMYACRLLSKYTQTSMKRLRAAHNNAYRIMHYQTHTRLAIVSGPLMACWETICIDVLYDPHLHPTLQFDHFKCLMLFTNLHFSSFIQSCCMILISCNSCWGIVSVFASDQYCFCVVKICGQCVHTKH